MIIDKQAQFSAAQAVTITAPSTNIYDTGAAADAGAGKKLENYCSLDEAFLTLTSLTIGLESATDAAFTVPVVHARTTPILAAALTLNAKIDLPPWPAGLNRYLRLNYTVAGAAATAGKISAGIILDDQKWSSNIAGSP